VSKWALSLLVTCCAKSGSEILISAKRQNCVYEMDIHLGPTVPCHPLKRERMLLITKPVSSQEKYVNERCAYSNFGKNLPTESDWEPVSCSAEDRYGWGAYGSMYMAVIEFGADKDNVDVYEGDIGTSGFHEGGGANAEDPVVKFTACGDGGLCNCGLRALADGKLFVDADGVYDLQDGNSIVRLIECNLLFLIDPPALLETLDLQSDDVKHPIRIDLYALMVLLLAVFWKKAHQYAFLTKVHHVHFWKNRTAICIEHVPIDVC
jgi:hypothetical protein